MQTLLPSCTVVRLSIQEFSPIQQSSPTTRCQGYLTVTPGLMTTRLPILEPKSRSRLTRSEDEGIQKARSSGKPRSSHAARQTTERPGSYQELSYVCSLTWLMCVQFLSRSTEARIGPPCTDRKSTRLNSSHLVISYAVFCLKKKKKKKNTDSAPHSRLRKTH